MNIVEGDLTGIHTKCWQALYEDRKNYEISISKIFKVHRCPTTKFIKHWSLSNKKNTQTEGILPTLFNRSKTDKCPVILTPFSWDDILLAVSRQQTYPPSQVQRSIFYGFWLGKLDEPLCLYNPRNFLPMERPASLNRPQPYFLDDFLVSNFSKVINTGFITGKDEGFIPTYACTIRQPFWDDIVHPSNLPQ